MSILPQVHKIFSPYVGLFIELYEISGRSSLMSLSHLQVKHAQCFDVALMDDGSVVLASKDYRLYIYRYVQVQ